jgi:hypothetical protein
VHSGFSRRRRLVALGFGAPAAQYFAALETEPEADTGAAPVRIAITAVIRLLITVAFAFAFATSAEAMSPAGLFLVMAAKD